MSRLKPSTKVSIYNERAGSGGHRKEGPEGALQGQEAGPLARPLKGPKPNSRFLMVLYPREGTEAPGVREAVGHGMGWGGEAWAEGGDGGKAASAPRLPPAPRRTHSFPWDEHRKG